MAARRRRPATPDALAAAIGCDLGELGGLLLALPATTANRRRREILVRHFLGGETFAAIALAEGVSPARFATLAEQGIALLVECRAGNLDIPTRIRRVFGIRAGGATLGDTASRWDCASLLRQNYVGRKSIRELHAVLARRGLSLRCGCPAERCEVALEKIAIARGPRGSGRHDR